MLRSITPVVALAALLGAGQARPAASHEMQVLQGGENFEVQWTGGPRDNLAGGGVVRLDGGGDDRTLVYEPRSTQGQSAFATLQGGGDDRTLTRTPAEAPASMLAQGPTTRMPELAQAPATSRRR
jgi:hypothetical protein